MISEINLNQNNNTPETMLCNALGQLDGRVVTKQTKDAKFASLFKNAFKAIGNFFVSSVKFTCKVVLFITGISPLYALTKLFWKYLTSPSKTPRHKRGEAVIKAAKEGDLARIKTLLAKGEISEAYRGQSVRWAALSGHLEIVKVLLENGEIFEYDRGVAIQRAAYYGHLDVIKTLLANGEISKADRGMAVDCAARNGHLAIVQALLADGEEISKEYRGYAVGNAAYRGHLDVIKTLLANGEISEEDRGRAVENAARNGHQSTADFLRDNSADAPVNELRRSTRERKPPVRLGFE